MNIFQFLASKLSLARQNAFSQKQNFLPDRNFIWFCGKNLGDSLLLVSCSTVHEMKNSEIQTPTFFKHANSFIATVTIGYVDFQPKIFPILYPSLENSITGIAILRRNWLQVLQHIFWGFFIDQPCIWSHKDSGFTKSHVNDSEDQDYHQRGCPLHASLHCYFIRLKLEKWGLSNLLISITRNSQKLKTKRIFEIM